VLLASLILHELGHAYAAWRLGDPTAKMLGRLTLNPVAHLDGLGTATLAVTAFASTAVPGANVIFGWAKPVPVIQEYFPSRRRAMAIVAVAGPLANVALAIVLAFTVVHAGLTGRAQVVLLNALGLNIALVLFNLLPIPPLDGARLVGALLPDGANRRWELLDRYGVFAILALVLLVRGPAEDAVAAALVGTARFLLRLVGG
jgi:Zn-dependent protease